MSVAIDNICQLCGESIKPLEGSVHGICGVNENTRHYCQLNATEQPCHLCGKPLMPYEHGVHNECATLENMRGDMGS